MSLCSATGTLRVGERTLTPRLPHYLLQELQDAVPLPGQALSLLSTLQPDLGSLGIQGSHPLLGSRQRGELAISEPQGSARAAAQPCCPPCPHLSAGDAAVALGPALQELLAPQLALLLEAALPLQLLELQVLEQLGLRLQHLTLLWTHKRTADHSLWTGISTSHRETSHCAPTSRKRCLGIHGRACPPCGQGGSFP